MSKLVNGNGVVRSEFQFKVAGKFLMVLWLVMAVVIIVGAGSPLEGIVITVPALSFVIFLVSSLNSQWVECDERVVRVKRFWRQDAVVYGVDEVTAIEFVGSWQSFHVYQIQIGHTAQIFLRSAIMSNVEELVGCLEECRQGNGMNNE